MCKSVYVPWLTYCKVMEIPCKAGALGVMMSGISERSKYIHKLMNISANVSAIYLENFKISDRFQDNVFLMKAHKILVHSRVQQTINLDA
jgi:hypothetical protein